MHDAPGFTGVEDYLKLSHNPSTWLVKDLIPLGGAALLYGLPKTGKSALAIQLAIAIANGDDEWMGFQLVTPGRVLYLQLDTPRSTWRLRFDAIKKHTGLYLNNDNLMIADRDSLAYFPFDILQPTHVKYLKSIIEPLQPVAVIVDTLRKAHSGDEDKSTTMSNVVSNLIAVSKPAALILVSHSRKPNPEAATDIMSSHRGSGSVVGEMDAILQMSNTTIKYGGRNIEEGEFKISKQEVDDVLLWRPRDEDNAKHIMAVIGDVSLKSRKAKARMLAKLMGVQEGAAESLLRRVENNERYRVKLHEPNPDYENGGVV